VTQAPAAGWTQSSPAGGTYDAILAAGDVRADLDFGNYRLASISGVSYQDLNGDGARGDEEPALVGRTVFLDADGDGQLGPGETSVTTDAGGYYTFDELPSGVHLVAQTVPDGWVQTQPVAGPHAVLLGPNQSVGGVDFGSRSLVSAIRGSVWHDTDGQPPLVGWTVYLDLDADGELDLLEPTTVTDAAGDYEFVDLPAADYTVGVVVPDGWERTSPVGVTAGDAEFIEVIDDGPGGVAGLQRVAMLAVSADGRHVYAVGRGNSESALFVFTRDAATGSLTFVQRVGAADDGIDGLDGVWWLQLSPDGQHLYTAAAADNAIVVFGRDEATGMLTFVEAVHDGTGGVEIGYTSSVALSGDGRHAYVTGGRGQCPCRVRPGRGDR
jgi:hypothetical protein